MRVPFFNGATPLQVGPGTWLVPGNSRPVILSDQATDAFGAAIAVATATSLGSSLTLQPHTPSVVAEYWVDPVSGNDSTGAGTSGNPWQTLEGAIANLRTGSAGAPASWAASGDVALNLQAGTYQAASGAQQTVEITFNNSSRAPNASRWLIIRPAAGVDRADVIVKPPAGATGAKYAIKTYDSGASWFGEYVQLRGFTIDGESTRRGATDVVGVYVNQTPNFQVVGLEIKGLQAANTGGASSKAQGIYAEASSTSFMAWWNLIHDNGTTTGTIDAQEHGIYWGSPGASIVGNIVYNHPNGFGLQCYSGSAISDTVIAANTVGGTTEKSCIVVSGNGSNQRIVNNILVGATQYGIEFVPATFTGTGNQIHHNITNGCAAGQRSHATPAGWTITSELTSDPLLAGPTADWHPGVGSPAIDAADQAWSPSVDHDGTAWTTADIGALEASSATTVPVGVATETDGGLAVARRKARVTATAATIESGLTAARRKAKAAGVGVEVDAGQLAARRKVRTIGVATETDAALTITTVGDTVVPVVVAAETDAATATGRAKTKTLGVAAETDAATTATRRKAKAAGFPTETDTALTAGRLSRTTTGVAAETDSATAASRRKAKAAGVPAEADSSLTANRRKVKALGVATEADAAQTIARGEPGVNTAAETDTGLTLTRRKVKVLGVATDAELAQPVTKAHRRAVGVAASADTGLQLLRLRRLTLAAALEASEAGAAVRVKRMLLGFPVETDTALAVEFAGAVVVVVGGFDPADPAARTIQANAADRTSHRPTALTFDPPEPRLG